MNKMVRIIALIMAILMGLSAIGMIAMYVAAESVDSANPPASLALSETESRCFIKTTPSRTGDVLIGKVL